MNEVNDPCLVDEVLFATHKQPCAVFFDQSEKAVYNCNAGVFEPSWKAQERGYFLVCAAPGWRRWLLKKLYMEL